MLYGKQEYNYCYLTETKVEQTNEKPDLKSLITDCICNEYPCLKSVTKGDNTQISMCYKKNLQSCYELACKKTLFCIDKDVKKFVSCDGIFDECVKQHYAKKHYSEQEKKQHYWLFDQILSDMKETSEKTSINNDITSSTIGMFIYFFIFSYIFYKIVSYCINLVLHNLYY